MEPHPLIAESPQQKNAQSPTNDDENADSTITLTDCIGRKFALPFQSAKTWAVSSFPLPYLDTLPNSVY